MTRFAVANLSRHHGNLDWTVQMVIDDVGFGDGWTNLATNDLAGAR